MTMVEPEDYEPTADEMVWFGEQGGFNVTSKDTSEIPEITEIEQLNSKPDVEALMADMVRVVILEGPQAFVEFIHNNSEVIIEAIAEDSRVGEAVVIGYKLGIMRKSGVSANNLGALYYMGNIVEQDYAKAAELYELAMDWGCYQSVINLGYIYEYGRIGEPDYLKAYMYYSLAAAYAPKYEALYKLGDMFSRGKVFPRDIKKAHVLWEKSLDMAEDIEEEAQAAIRIAPLLLDLENVLYDIDYNPLRALHLYQTAEIGLRISIGKGYDYYSKRLDEAIKGQQEAREALGMTAE